MMMEFGCGCQQSQYDNIALRDGIQLKLGAYSTTSIWEKLFYILSWNIQHAKWPHQSQNKRSRNHLNTNFLNNFEFNTYLNPTYPL